MKHFIPACIVSLCWLGANAQIKSSHDGFYSADSVFYQLQGPCSFKYCVNCYSADSLHAYTGGVWLYSREHKPNTWENSRFSVEPVSGDTNHIRPAVVKANTIWVRVYNDTGYTDQHHFVYLGNWRPKTSLVVSCLLDSSDFIGLNGFYGPGQGMQQKFEYQWNYMLKIEKNCTYQVFGGTNFQLEAGQTAGIEISASYSAVFPNKALQLNANRTANKKKVLDLGKSLEDSLGSGIKTIRFRVGGGNHRSNILANEIATGIIRPDLGGEPSTPVCLFINGSFWTYALAEEGMSPNRISKTIKASHNELTTARVPIVAGLADLKKNGIPYTQLNNSVYSICGFSNVCQQFYFYNDTAQFEIDTGGTGYNPEALGELCAAVKNGSDSLLAATIDREAFYRYALSIWFFQNPEGWAKRLILAKVGSMPWQPYSEHYDFEPQSPMANDWDIYFTNFFIPAHSKAKRTLPWQATKRMLQYDAGYFCLVIEDELNTTYNPQRTVLVAQQKIASLRPCINECSYAWAGNDWLDSLNWEKTVSGIIPFLQHRPDGIAQALPKIFMAGADTLWQLKDRNEVSVRFNQVPGKDVTVRLNSLELKSDFTGKYYPGPKLRIALQYDPQKYVFIKWLEYPGQPAVFTLSANKPITLTPVLTLKK